MPLFAATLAVSALLLFIVQPMVGKMILPTYGGTPGVWTTCMVFFQTVLLAGYAYAHGSVTLLGARRQMRLHVMLLLTPFLFLPVALASGEPPPADADPVRWLLQRLFLSVGLPLFVVSSTAPLLQKWFSLTGHDLAGDPYFLYAASNTGSLLALVAYPLLVEPNLDLARQSRLWTVGYVALVLMIFGCAALVRRSARWAVPAGVAADDDEAIGRSRRIRWVLLALVPSSLLLGVTAHITTNVAAVPLLWTVPLAIYLLTFVLGFARRIRIPHRWIVAVFPYVLLTLGPLALFDTRDLSWLGVLPHLFLFFIVALMCHGELAEDRPPARHLTEFYLWISIGGVLGGLFNAVVAPLLFNGIAEYPLMLAAGAFLLPGRRPRKLDLLLPLAPALLFAGIFLGTGFRFSNDDWRAAAVLFSILAMICFTFRAHWLRFGLGFSVYIAAVALMGSVPSGHLLHVERNFFGVKSVVLDDDERFHELVHGTTNHGMQWIEASRRGEPTAYYDRRGPMGDVFAALRPQSVGVVGLGTGGLAAYATPGRRFTFYEIDPAVERIARDPRYFTYLDRCGAACDVFIGDGRLLLARTPPDRFELLVLDAFSSDAVPTHLLTTEAVKLYLETLRGRGVLVFNITNAYLDLTSVMGNLAASLGLTAIHRDDPAGDPRDGWMPSHYAALARRPEDLAALAARPGWAPLQPDPTHRVWTDQFSGILSLFRPPRGRTEP